MGLIETRSDFLSAMPAGGQIALSKSRKFCFSDRMRSPNSPARYLYLISLVLLIWVFPASADITSYKAGEFQTRSDILWGNPNAGVRVGLQVITPKVETGESIVVQVVSENVSSEMASVTFLYPTIGLFRVAGDTGGLLSRKDLPQGDSFQAKLGRSIMAHKIKYLEPGDVVVESYAIDQMFDFKGGERYSIVAEKTVTSLADEHNHQAASGNLILALPVGWKAPDAGKKDGVTLTSGSPVEPQPSTRVTTSVMNAASESRSTVKSLNPAVAKSADKSAAEPLSPIREAHQTDASNFHPFPLFALACLVAIIFVLSRAALRKK